MPRHTTRSIAPNANHHMAAASEHNAGHHDEAHQHQQYLAPANSRFRRIGPVLEKPDFERYPLTLSKTATSPSHARPSGRVHHCDKPGAIEENALIKIEKRRKQRDRDLIPMRDGVQASRHHVDYTCGRGPRSQARKTAAVEQKMKGASEQDKIEWRKKETKSSRRQSQSRPHLQRRLASMQSPAEIPKDNLHRSAVPAYRWLIRPVSVAGALVWAIAWARIPPGTPAQAWKGRGGNLRKGKRREWPLHFLIFKVSKRLFSASMRSGLRAGKPIRPGKIMTAPVAPCESRKAPFARTYSKAWNSPTSHFLFRTRIWPETAPTRLSRMCHNINLSAPGSIRESASIKKNQAAAGAPQTES